MNRKRIYLSPPHTNGYELEYIKDAIDTNWIAPLGPHVNGFESELADYVGISHAVALSSGTSGIHLALKYLGVSEKDYVFCSTFTFAGTCNPIMYEKAIPVFIDSDSASWNMSSLALERAFEWAKKQYKIPKAVIVVNLYGQSADWSGILPICQYYNVPVIEDAAESLGSTYMGKQTGNFGYVGVFSFNGNKIITTSGGGMVVCEDEDAIKKMRFWATQAREAGRHYEHKEVGYNYRMSNICAAIGRGQLKTINEKITAKKSIYEYYEKAFCDLPVKMMPLLSKCSRNYWLSTLTIDRKCNIVPEDIIIGLESEDIESRPLWKPMHLQPVYKKYPYFSHNEYLRIAEDLYERGICLPSGSAMTSEELNRVVNVVKRIIIENKTTDLEVKAIV